MGSHCKINKKFVKNKETQRYSVLSFDEASPLNSVLTSCNGSSYLIYYA